MFKNLIAMAHNLLTKAQAATPEIIAAVNEIRLVTHLSGCLSPEDEKKFQTLAGRFAGLIVNHAVLAPLPPLNAEGLRLDGPTYDQWVAAGKQGGAYPPEGYAPNTAAPVKTEAQAEFDAGVVVGMARGTVPDGASDSFKAGYVAGMSTGVGAPGSSPSPNPPLDGSEAPAAPQGATGTENDTTGQTGDDLEAAKTT